MKTPKKLIKRLSAVLMAGIMFAGAAAVRAEGVPSVSASSALLLDAGSGRVIFEKDADTERPMASTTKIMTALIAVERCDLKETVTVPEKAVGVEGSSVYLYRDEKLTVEELVLAMMLESANDAATAIAIGIAGSVGDFAVLMNRRAEELGLSRTSFENPHGLDGENHYTTARDLAVLTAFAMKNETFRKIVSTYRSVIPMKNGEGSRLLVNHNRLLKSYDGAVGVKTGFTKKSGRCLVTAAERDGVMLIAVTLNDPDDWLDHRKMLDYGFSMIERVPLTGENGVAGTVSVTGGLSETVGYHSDGVVSADLVKGAHSLRTVIEMPHFLYAPVRAGEAVGRAVFYDGDTEIASCELYADGDVEMKKTKKTFFERIKDILGY